MWVWFFLWVIQGYAAFNLTWGTPAISLNSNPPVGDTDGSAVIAIDPMGNAIATWSRTTGSGASTDIWAATYNHSLRVWSGAMKISGGGNASNSRIAIDANGHAILAWDEGFPTQIMSRILTAQGVWIPDLSRAPTFVHKSKHAQIFPLVALDASGNAVVIWMEFSGGIYHIESAKKPFEFPWIHLGELSSGLQDAALCTRALAINETGDAIAVWQERNGSSSEIYGAQYIKGDWTVPVSISAEKGKNAHSPVAGIDTAGNAVIVWNQANVLFSKTIINGELSLIPLAVSNPAYVAQHPDIGVDAVGNAVVVFERHNTMHKFIAAASLPFKSTAWSIPTDISGPSSLHHVAGYPVLSINAIGDGVAIWKEQTETNRVIQGAGYALGTWSLTKTLSSPSGNAGASIPSHDIDVSVNLAGNIIAIWPEDPVGTGALQIKATAGAGLANVAPPPPLIEPMTVKEGIVYGSQVLHRFPAHADLINILTWTPPSGEVAHYKIYRGNLSSLIGTSTTPRYEDHQRTPKKQEIYLVTSVNSHGQESSPITIIVPPR